MNEKRPTFHVMIDLETLSTENNAVILQFAAVAFDPMALAKGEQPGVVATFDMFPTLRSQLSRRVDETFLWWMKQAPAAQRIQADAQREDLRLVLSAFSQWYNKVDGKEVWAHGATFDISIVKDAYATVNLPAPWGYRDHRDTRTLFDDAALVRQANGREKTAIPAFTGVEHDALADAIFQAILVQQAFADLAAK
jgi:exodeoxyribonuclease VIII